MDTRGVTQRRRVHHPKCNCTGCTNMAATLFGKHRKMQLYLSRTRTLSLNSHLHAKYKIACRFNPFSPIAFVRISNIILCFVRTLSTIVLNFTSALEHFSKNDEHFKALRWYYYWTNSLLTIFGFGEVLTRLLARKKTKIQVQYYRWTCSECFW